MNTSLRVLIVDDHSDDATLIAESLRQYGFAVSWKRVETAVEFIADLETQPEVILASYALPKFGALEALRILEKRDLNIPLIVVTTPAGDEAAAQCIKQGASDYLLKTELSRLGGAVVLALQATILRQENRRAEELIYSIIHSSPDMIIATDAERKIVEFNPAAEKVFGYAREEVLGRHIGMLYATGEESDRIYSTVLQDGQVVQEILNQRKDGQIFLSLLSASVLHDQRGRQIGVVGVSRDVTEQKRLEDQLRYLSMHDSLTGLYNRAYFEQEMARLQRGRQFPISIIMTDLDDLKLVNDQLGHAAGDELLRQAAQSLSASFRSADVVARIGGDEFAALLPRTDAVVTQTLLSRLRRNVEAHNGAHPRLGLGLSIGTATAEKGSVLADVLKQADENMYQDKSQKRKSPVHD